MDPVLTRESIVSRLKADLIGPHKPDEVLQGPRVRPSDVYLTGILWTYGDRMGNEDDDGDEGDDEEADAPSTASLVGQQRPCSMGVSICTSTTSGAGIISVTVRFATYEFERVQAQGDEPAQLKWTRRPFLIELNELKLPDPDDRRDPTPLRVEGLVPEVQLHLRTRLGPAGYLTTVTLINRSETPLGDRNAAEALLLFQTELEIRPGRGTKLVSRPPRPSANDEDEEVGRLLYRNVPDFAAGHQCSASWESSNEEAFVIRSDWMPCTSVIAFKEDGHEVFEDLLSQGTLDAQQLASLPDAEVLKRLSALPHAYKKWIEIQQSRLDQLSGGLRAVGERNLGACIEVAERMADGVQALINDPKLLRAFKLSNAAMALQHSWKPAGKLAPLRWRPFQLGFILLSARSVCDPTAPDRDIFDLLWFPTGGGKTEAYLTLVGMLAFYRRSIHSNPDDGGGTAAIMRYTLRLLTAQQFERAASLILACELIRKGRVANVHYALASGTTPFSIGLWVGGDATPNHFTGERGALANRGNRDGTTAEQIDRCPCCHGRVRWNYDTSTESVRAFCESSSCQLGPSFGDWPVFTVDDDIYRERPTLVIGTIDKFALVTTNKSVADLFAFGTAQSPDLIIQDELHLISGPLGTIAGIYETAFDWLLRKHSYRPKVLGSTATIRRAADQVRSLFDRQSCQFPPSGIDYDDSGFAVRDVTKPPRMYVGVTTAGRSAKFTLQATAGSLLQSTGSTVGLSHAERDGYATLLAYFNSLRELGGAIVQMLDDVPDSMELYAGRRGETTRENSPPRELTSRVSQKEIIEILSELKIPAGSSASVDVVLATNMVSVGVDVSRLGLMVINGQPKTRSEYIQATSRVGRSSFPGLVVAVLNAAKPRDRSHFETFFGWHSTLYRDVEATSVTPFASRARDRALHAALVAMIRHLDPSMRKRPNLDDATDELLSGVVSEIERRVLAIDPREVSACQTEIDELLDNWQARSPTYYINPKSFNKSLLISADLNARRRATGRLPPDAWPTMNNMRSVEATTPFRMTEVLVNSGPNPNAASEPPDSNAQVTDGRTPPRWRTTNG